MTEEIDAVFFDAGGTMFDMSPTKAEVFDKVFRAHGLEADERAIGNAVRKAERALDKDFAECDLKGERAFWRGYDAIVAREVGYRGDLEELTDSLEAEFDKVAGSVEGWVEYPDTKPLLEDVRKRDFKFGVVSNATDLLFKVMDNLQLTKYFDFVIASEVVGVRKPDPRIFRMAAEKAKAKPSRSLYVGDKFTVDFMGAKNAGMQAILVDRDNVYSDVHCLKVRNLKALHRFL